jgi:5-methylcytosine-specific restriction endonuclease McrA
MKDESILHMALDHGMITKRNALIAKSKYQHGFVKCELCGEKISLRTKNKRMKLSIDHIIPRSRGGSNCFDNLQLTHIKCNQIKRDRMMGSLNAGIAAVEKYKHQQVESKISLLV